VVTVKNLALLMLPWGVMAAVACNSKGAASSAPPAAVSAAAAAIAAPGSAAAAAPATAAVAAVAATPSAAPAAAEAAPGLIYSVVGVAGNDVLNVREKPEVGSKKLYSYAPVVKNIRATGQHVEKGATPWVEVSFDGGTGWVNRLFLSEVHPNGGCNDPELTAVIRAFEKAVTDSDGAGLKAVVSPLRGLTVTPESKPLKFPYASVDSVFKSPAVLNLGPGSGGGPDITGTFKATIDITLRKSILSKGAHESCGKLETGGSAGIPPSLDEFPGVTPVSFYFAGVDGSGWVTWVGSIEYVDGKPYFSALKQFHWEI
jgi:hypothetical protein